MRVAVSRFGIAFSIEVVHFRRSEFLVQTNPPPMALPSGSVPAGGWAFGADAGDGVLPSYGAGSSITGIGEGRFCGLAQ